MSKNLLLATGNIVETFVHDFESAYYDSFEWFAVLTFSNYPWLVGTTIEFYNLGTYDQLSAMTITYANNSVSSVINNIVDMIDVWGAVYSASTNRIEYEFDIDHLIVISNYTIGFRKEYEIYVQ